MGKFLIVLMALVAIGLAAGGFWYVSTYKPAAISQTRTAGVTSNVEALPTNPTAQDYWNWLKVSNIEPTCLAKIKEAAGDNAWAVNSCKCQQTAAGEWKNYSCMVGTLAGEKNVEAQCNREQGKCKLEGEGQSAEYTFEELARTVRYSNLIK